MMTQARATHTATALGDGTVLIAGGITRYARQKCLYPISTSFWWVNSSVERFNPVTRQFSVSAVGLTVARYWQTATLLPTGYVLLTGGASLATKVCYNPLPPRGIYINPVTATADTIH